MIDSSTLGRLPGMHVVSTDGERIGTVRDAYESTDGGVGTFATVSTGLFGTKSSFFPLDEAELRGDEVVVPYSKALIKDAPRVDDDEALTDEEEQRLFAHYAGAHGVVDGGTGAVADTGTDTGTDTAITRSEERLRVGTERVETGRARLRKHVVTETESRTVPLRREQVRVERQRLDGVVVSGELAGRELVDEEFEIVLTAERAVVTTEAVPVERVRLDTDVVQAQETVTGEVRKERIELEDVERTTDGDPDRLR